MLYIIMMIYKEILGLLCWKAFYAVGCSFWGIFEWGLTGRIAVYFIKIRHVPDSEESIIINIWKY